MGCRTCRRNPGVVSDVIVFGCLMCCGVEELLLLRLLRLRLEIIVFCLGILREVLRLRQTPPLLLLLAATTTTGEEEIYVLCLFFPTLSLSSPGPSNPVIFIILGKRVLL